VAEITFLRGDSVQAHPCSGAHGAQLYSTSTTFQDRMRIRVDSHQPGKTADSVLGLASSSAHSMNPVSESPTIYHLRIVGATGRMRKEAVCKAKINDLITDLFNPDGLENYDPPLKFGSHQYSEEDASKPETRVLLVSSWPTSSFESQLNHSMMDAGQAGASGETPSDGDRTGCQRVLPAYVYAEGTEAC
jgi:hypothetical protein